MQRTKRNGYSELLQEETNDVPLRQNRTRHAPSLEAEILPGDTLVSISLRFNCSVQDIKRLNKIDKDNEIFAFKVLKVPLTAQNILLDTLPKVHKTSGQNSPTNKEKVSSNSADDASKEKLEEKLLVASVSNAVLTTSEDAADRSTNLGSSFEDITSEPLLDRTQFRGYIRTFGAPKSDYLSFNGSDCELNWVVLLLCILAVCLLVPLIYVYIAYEHPEEFSHSKYDDPDLKRLHHINILNATTRKP